MQLAQQHLNTRKHCPMQFNTYLAHEYLDPVPFNSDAFSFNQIPEALYTCWTNSAPKHVLKSPALYIRKSSWQGAKCIHVHALYKYRSAPGLTSDPSVISRNTHYQPHTYTCPMFTWSAFKTHISLLVQQDLEKKTQCASDMWVVVFIPVYPSISMWATASLWHNPLLPGCQTQSLGSVWVCCLPPMLLKTTSWHL